MDYNDMFNSRLQNLNTEQKKAVKNTEGPVMVIAGPGTGKTEVLAARIAYIISNKDLQANPHNLLCLTFTDAGKVAMRKRLVEFIGTEAYKVHIHTFHSFCNEVIQQNLDYFGKRNLSHISDLEKIYYLEEIVDSFNPKHTLFKSSGYYETTRLRNLFETMKSENWTSNDINKAINTYIENLPNREDFQYKRPNKIKGISIGDPNTRLINAEIEKLEKLRAAANEYPKYCKMMQENERYDYQDMILWVIDAFKKNENILAKYQEQFQYILVDEFQDTNGAQKEVLDILSSYWEEPNVFIVGDDDQSIFRFQGANLKNILSFYEKFKDKAKTFILDKNYRSSQNILNIAKTLIEYNTERLISDIPKLEKNIKAANKEIAESNVKPKIIEYSSVIEEEIGVIEEIEKLKKENIKLNEIAVLYREHKQATNIIKVLLEKDIPINLKESINILNTSLIKKLITIFQYLQNEIENPHHSEHLLFQIMHFDFFGLDTNNIAKQFYLYKKERKVTFREYLLNLSKEKENSDKNKIFTFAKMIEDWIKRIHNESLYELIEFIISDCGIIKHVLNSEDKMFLIRVISSFIQFLKDEINRNKNITLKQFLKTFDQMNLHNIRIPLIKFNSYENGVNFLSAHSSKGLEFKYVFLIGCSRNAWDIENKGYFEYSFPDTLTLSNVGSYIEESRRLFYVAITRAKEYLYISYSTKDSNNKEIEKSQFIEELNSNKNDFINYNINSSINDKSNSSLNDKSNSQSCSCSTDKIIEYQTLLLSSSKKPNYSKLEKIYIDEILDNFRLNITHINKFLKCPLSFYFDHILKVPQPVNEHTAFGTAVHEALYDLYINNKKTEDLLINSFTKSFNRFKSFLSPKIFNRRLEYGKNVLKDYFENYKNDFKSNIIIEININNVSFEGIALSGKIDKIEILNGKEVNIVDYKTGKYNKDKLISVISAKNEKTNNSKNNIVGINSLSYNSEDIDGKKYRDDISGDYFRQLVFYKLLIDLDPTKNYIVKSGEIDFIEKDQNSKDFKKEKIFFTKENEDILKNQIKNIYRRIKSHDFYDGCGDENCWWCQFINNQ